MKPVRVLDPGHVLAVCTHAVQEADGAGARPLPKIALTSTDEAVTIRIAADAAHIAAILGALHRAGYDATAAGDLITVRGWSPARLHKRLARLDAAAQWLTEQLPFTASTAVALYQTARERPSITGRAARNHARHQAVCNLRDLVQRQTGPLTWHDVPGQVADPRTGMLLRECRWLEDELDLLLSRHRAIATQAIAEHRLTAEPEHGAQPDAEQIEPADADHARQPAHVPAQPDTSHPVASSPAAVAAHDAPAKTDAPPEPSLSGTQSDSDVRQTTSPARRGA